MSLTNQFREELQEEGNDKQTYMHAVNIGVSGHNHLIIPKRIHTLFNIECSLKQVELLILINYLFGQSEGIQRLSS